MVLNCLTARKKVPAHQTGLITSTASLLSDLKPNAQARIVGFSPTVSSDRKTRLQALGVLPGNRLRVQQIRPVTIVQIEHTELALEQELAELIIVQIC